MLDSRACDAHRAPKPWQSATPSTASLNGVAVRRGAGGYASSRSPTTTKLDIDLAKAHERVMAYKRFLGPGGHAGVAQGRRGIRAQCGEETFFKVNGARGGCASLFAAQRRVRGDQTPAGIDMEEGDMLDCMEEQGGCEQGRGRDGSGYSGARVRRTPPPTWRSRALLFVMRKSYSGQGKRLVSRVVVLVVGRGREARRRAAARRRRRAREGEGRVADGGALLVERRGEGRVLS